ncbi:MAG: hypothetical protein N3D84_01185, partial [Candidatus Woesearchaeota archaeon]|nr:hypothetical protein [Candidatus Woesearchaeota archaeon]
LNLTQFKRINKVQPTIAVRWHEQIFLQNATLYWINTELSNNFFLSSFLATQDTSYLYGVLLVPVQIKISASFDTIYVTPAYPLHNGYYVLHLKVVDFVDNEAEHFEYINIDAPETNIEIIEPKFGVSNKPIKNLTIRTTRNNAPENTECKIGVQNPFYDFDSISLKSFETPPVMKPEHTMENIFSQFNLRDRGTFYIICKDQTLNRTNQKKFDVYIDVMPPSIIGFKFEPEKIVEYPEVGNLNVVLNVSTNEPTICKYSFNEKKNYTEMVPFDSYNQNNFDAYKTTNTQKYFLPDAKEAVYPFYVQCEDKAGWTSEQKKYDLVVDLTAPLGISVLFPPKAIQPIVVDFTVSTTKRAICMIKGQNIVEFTSMIADIKQKLHKYSLGALTDGSYSYIIHCKSVSAGTIQEQQLSYSFVVDSSRPSAPAANGSFVTCFNNKFEFMPPLVFTAEDSESGIKEFLYQIKNGTQTIVNWSSTKSTMPVITKDDKRNPLSLNNQTPYSLVVKAINNAGLEGPEATFTIKYDPLDTSCFEKNPPSVFILENKTKGKTIIEFSCQDESGCDPDNYYYGVSDSAEMCIAETKIEEPFILEIRETSYVCYIIKDVVGNSATGSKLIEVEFADTCQNQRKDGDETDVDCGGSCGLCSLNASCIKNSDCDSNYCINNKCAEPTCSDGVMNGPLDNEETDIDCGGYCSDLGFKCKDEKSCEYDRDCESGFCTPEKKCQASTCFDGYKGPLEADVDCGGECEVKCAEGMKCSSANDCISENCMGGICGKKETMVKAVVGFGYKKILAIILAVLGILLIGGGVGYLSYKKYSVPAAKKTKIEKTVAKETLEEEKRVEEERKRILEEQRRRIEEERKKREELAKKRIEALEKKKREERERVFGKFGEAKVKKEEVPYTRIEGFGEKEWVPLEELGKRPKKAIEKKEEEIKRTPTAPGPSETFEELEKIVKEKEGEEKIKEEEVFKKLEKISKEKEDAFEKLKKYIKPEKEEEKKKKKR